jgi:hypothetical protein
MNVEAGTPIASARNVPFQLPPNWQFVAMEIESLGVRR